APGTRSAHYRCSLPGLAGFTSIASPRAINITGTWRRVRDSNPRYLSIHTISNRAPSTTRSTLQVFQPSEERVGFEPTVGLPLRLLSRQVPSTTRSSLRASEYIGLRPRRQVVYAIRRSVQLGPTVSDVHAGCGRPVRCLRAGAAFSRRRSF